MYGWVGGLFLSKVEPDATAYDKKKNDTLNRRKSNATIMNRQKDATQTKEKETKGRNKKREDNDETNIVVKTIGRAT